MIRSQPVSTLKLFLRYFYTDLLLHYFGAITNTNSICVRGNFGMNLKKNWDDLDDFGMSLIKIG